MMLVTEVNSDLFSVSLMFCCAIQEVKMRKWKYIYLRPVSQKVMFSIEF